MVSTEKKPNVIIRAIYKVKLVNFTNQTPSEYPSLKALKLHLAVFLSMERIGRKASDVWRNLPWKRFRHHVFRLQRAIFKAQKDNHKAKVKRLQRLLLRSRAAQALAVKQVTQLNTGRKSPELTGKQRFLLKSA